jgi:hypothetical protein
LPNLDKVNVARAHTGLRRLYLSAGRTKQAAQELQSALDALTDHGSVADATPLHRTVPEET